MHPMLLHVLLAVAVATMATVAAMGIMVKAVATMAAMAITLSTMAGAVEMVRLRYQSLSRRRDG